MVVFSQCMDCKNYIGKKGDAFRCKAFPEGIPDDILCLEFTNSHFFTDFDAIGDNFARLLI